MDELVRMSLLLGALSLPPQAPPAHVPELRREQARKPDNWLGHDKFQHFWVSFAATSFTFAAASAADLDTDASLTIALPAGALIGVGKEVNDRRRGEVFSRRDLVADALGIAAAWFLLREVR